MDTSKLEELAAEAAAESRDPKRPLLAARTEVQGSD